ncbi:MAG: universal stress protein, partial [Desulfobulbaceae bacterium]|nr:universal stress protein [Desulfobulbaceae bacterium]
MERNILVPVDGSTHSGHSLSYISRLFSDSDDVKFHLLSIVFCSSKPSGVSWMTEQEMMNMLGPDVRARLLAMKKNAKKMVQKLVDQGVSPEQITSDVKMTTGGVASEIVGEARKEQVDAVLIGRRGLGKVGEMFMGSVSSTVLEKCHDIPVWVIDGKVDSRKFMVPVDGRVHSLKAVDHLSFILKDNPHAEITLFHSKALFARSKDCDPTEFHNEFGEEWSNKHACRFDLPFHAPEQILTENGFPRERIHRLETTAGFEPAQQIVRQALIDDLGTIVMGRR